MCGFDFFKVTSVLGWCCVTKVICEEAVLSKVCLIAMLLILFDKYLLVDDNPNPLVVSASLEIGLLIIACRPKMMFQRLNLTNSQDKF